MEDSDQNQEPKDNKIKKSIQLLWRRIKPKIKPGNVLGAFFAVVFLFWFGNEPSYEPLLGILTSITALLSFNTDKSFRDDWLLVGILVVVAGLGIFFIRQANDPEEVIVGGIFYDGVEDQEGDEFVVIRNQDTKDVQLEGWTLHDNQSNHVFTFPMYEMQPGEECRIYTDEDHPEWCGFNFRNGGSGVWNNTGGDMATLRNAEGIMIDSSIDLIMTPEGEVVLLPTEDENVPIGIDEGDALTTGNIVITKVFYNGEKGADEPDEYVEIRNDDVEAIQLKDWTLSDESNHIFKFTIFSIEAGQTCRIYTDEEHPDWCGFNYKKHSAIWGNSGDCATLRDGDGLIINKSCYP